MGPRAAPLVASLRRARALAAVATILIAATGEALARGYRVTAAGGRVEAAPPGASEVDVSSSGGAARATAAVRLPFDVWIYGVRCRTAVVSAHGWLLPGATEGFADADRPARPHGQDAASGAFPYGPGPASADGIVAPLWAPFTGVNDGSAGAGRVVTWTSGEAPRRRFVVSWERVGAGSGGRITVQAHLREDGEITFAYTSDPLTGDATPPANWVCGLDAPRDARFTAPLLPSAANVGLPPSDFVLTPRTVAWNSPDAPRCGVVPKWDDSRLESLRGDDGEKDCCYVATGSAYMWVADRAFRGNPARRKELAEEDRAAFGGEGDPSRWVRQVLDGKAVLVPADGSPVVRFWFRVVEFFSLDDRGLTGRDDHVWNLRIMLRMAFPEGDPRAKIDFYCGWRAMASGRLAVVKLFPASQKSDAGGQFDTGRSSEYAQWCARFRVGTRGAMPAEDCPTEGWTRFIMRHPEGADEQLADRRGVRWVADPNYVESGYSYTVASDGPVPGWVSRRREPPASMTDEEFEHDPPPAPPRSGGR